MIDINSSGVHPASYPIVRPVQTLWDMRAVARTAPYPIVWYRRSLSENFYDVAYHYSKRKDLFRTLSSHIVPVCIVIHCEMLMLVVEQITSQASQAQDNNDVDALA